MINHYKRHIKLFAWIICTAISFVSEAQICDFHGKVIEIEGQQSLDIFNETSTLEYVNEKLIIDGSEMDIDELEDFIFTNRIELEEYLGCSFPIGKDFYTTATGKIKAFELDGVANGNNIQKLDYITFKQFGRGFKFVLINRTYLFEFVNAVSHVFKPATYYEESEILANTFEYIPPTEIMGEFTLIKEAEYETVTEQVLVSEGYSELTVIPAQFQFAYHYFHQETSSCPDAVVESESVPFIKKEEYSELEIVDAELVTVTELVLDVHAYYGPTYFKRESINLDTFKTDIRQALRNREYEGQLL